MPGKLHRAVWRARFEEALQPLNAGPTGAARPPNALVQALTQPSHTHIILFSPPQTLTSSRAPHPPDPGFTAPASSPHCSTSPARH